jgi:iron complex outermembrane recepter protein
MQYQWIRGHRAAILRAGNAIAVGNARAIKDRGVAPSPMQCATLIALAALAGIVTTAHAQSVLSAKEPALAVAASGADTLETIVVTARLRQENAQAVPISLSVVDSATIEKTFSNNIAQVALMVPSMNYTSPNPRNTALTIRGLGSSVVAIAQANDGLDPGVGFYVDQVYHGRPATAAFDFADLERVEVLRGPQGTLFGKNTTAGAINITSKTPNWQSEHGAEVSGGDIGYYQAKAYISGPLVADTLAGRVSAVVTGRDGVLHNVPTDGENNDTHNAAVRGQLLYTGASKFRLRLIADYSSFNSNCCTQVYFSVGTTLKPAARQYPALAAGVGYAPASLNPYDRFADIDAALKVDTNEGGLAAIADWDLEWATLTSVTAWRYWNWDAANDRDYTRLSIQTQQHIPSRQDQYSQELRIGSNGARTVDYTAGLYWYGQTLTGEPITVYGPLATYWLLGSAPLYPANLLDGYGTDGHTRFHADSYAAFGEATWHVSDKFAVTAGLRYTQEEKHGRFDSTVSGGLATTILGLIKARLSILRPQSYTASVSDGSPSGRVSLAYHWTDRIMAYASYANADKSGGINMSGLPLDANNKPALGTAVIKPEHDTTVEFGLKTLLFDQRLSLNADAYDTRVRDYQANVVDNAPGALRGYLANIENVVVKGAEVDAAFRIAARFTGYASAAWTDGKYVSYKNGPCPLESIGSTTTVCDLSGRPLPGTPRTAYSVGGEYAAPKLIGSRTGEWYLRADFTSRSDSYAEATDSKYTLIQGYGLVNASVGLRVARRWDLALWARNLLSRDYMQNLTVQAGNSGLVFGTPGDPRIWGLTVRVHW